VCPLTWTIVVLRTGRRSRPLRADVAQLVAHHLAKVRVAGSNPVIRSKVQVASTPAVEWPSGEATACKAVHTGSIPVSTSEFDSARLAQRESASLTRKRSLVQSQYRAPALPQLTCGNPPNLPRIGTYMGPDRFRRRALAGLSWNDARQVAAPVSLDACHHDHPAQVIRCRACGVLAGVDGIPR
jgi:hypothetical protein